jgi:hypothetical protein
LDFPNSQNIYLSKYFTWFFLDHQTGLVLVVVVVAVVFFA